MAISEQRLKELMLHFSVGSIEYNRNLDVAIKFDAKLDATKQELNEIKTTLINKIKENITIFPKIIEWRVETWEIRETKAKIKKPVITIGPWFRTKKAENFIEENKEKIIDAVEDLKLKILGSDYRIVIDGKTVEVGDKVAIFPSEYKIVGYEGWCIKAKNLDTNATYLYTASELEGLGFCSLEKASEISNTGELYDEKEKRKMPEYEVEQGFKGLEFEEEFENLKSTTTTLQEPDEPEQGVFTPAEGFEAKIEAKFQTLKAKKSINKTDLENFRNTKGLVKHKAIGGIKIVEFESENDPSQKDYLQVEVFKHPSKEMYTVYIKNLENGKIKILTCNHGNEISHHYHTKSSSGDNFEIAKVQGNALESTNPKNKQKFILNESSTISMEDVQYFLGLKDAIPNVSIRKPQQINNEIPQNAIKPFQRVAVQVR